MDFYELVQEGSEHVKGMFRLHYQKINPYTLLRINLAHFSVSFGPPVFKRVILACFFLQSHHKCSTTAQDVLKITTNPGSLLLQTIMLMITKNVHGAN